MAVRDTERANTGPEFKKTKTRYLAYAKKGKKEAINFKNLFLGAVNSVVVAFLSPSFSGRPSHRKDTLPVKSLPQPAAVGASVYVFPPPPPPLPVNSQLF